MANEKKLQCYGFVDKVIKFFKNTALVVLAYLTLAYVGDFGANKHSLHFKKPITYTQILADKVRGLFSSELKAVDEIYIGGVASTCIV